MNPLRKLATGSAVMLCALLLAPDRVAFAQEAEAKQLVVMLRGKLGTGPFAGAGMILGIGNNRLYIATANHVVRKGLNEAENLEMQLNWLPGEWVPVKLLDHGDKDLDLAVLVAQGAEDLAIPALHWEALGQPAELEQRDEVFPVGYPSGLVVRIGPASPGLRGRLPGCQDGGQFGAWKLGRGPVHKRLAHRRTCEQRGRAPGRIDSHRLGDQPAEGMELPCPTRARRAARQAPFRCPSTEVPDLRRRV